MIRLLSRGRNYVPSSPLRRISVTRSFANPCLTHTSLPCPPTMSGFASWLKRAASSHSKSASKSDSKAASSSAQRQQPTQPPANTTAPTQAKETTAPAAVEPAMLRHGEFVGSLDCGTTYVVRPFETCQAILPCPFAQVHPVHDLRPLRERGRPAPD